VQEPAEPHALAFACLADPVHPVVPIAGTHQRQAVLADAEARVERERAVLEQRSAFVRDCRLEVRVVLAGP